MGSEGSACTSWPALPSLLTFTGKTPLPQWHCSGQCDLSHTGSLLWAVDTHGRPWARAHLVRAGVTRRHPAHVPSPRTPWGPLLPQSLLRVCFFATRRTIYSPTAVLFPRLPCPLPDPPSGPVPGSWGREPVRTTPLPTASSQACAHSAAATGARSLTYLLGTQMVGRAGHSRTYTAVRMVGPTRGRVSAFLCEHRHETVYHSHRVKPGRTAPLGGQEG